MYGMECRGCTLWSVVDVRYGVSWMYGMECYGCTVAAETDSRHGRLLPAISAVRPEKVTAHKNQFSVHGYYTFPTQRGNPVMYPHIHSYGNPEVIVMTPTCV